MAALIAVALPAPYPASQTLTSVVAGCLLVAALWRPGPKGEARLPWPAPLALCGLALASAWWSALPLQSARSALVFAFVTIAVWAAARVLTLEDVVLSVVWAVRVVLCASVIVALIRPDIGLDNSDYETGALRGLFIHRNTLGYASTIAIITIFFSRHMRGRASLVFDVAVAMTCLVGSRSQSSLVVMVVAVIVVAVVGLTRRLDSTARVLAAVVVAIITAVATFWVSEALPQVTTALGRDQTLTGRTEIWAAVQQEISYRPLLGAGWDAVWEAGLPITYRMWNNTGFAAFTAHNGYLDILLQIGWAGMAILVVVLLVALLRGLKLAVSDGSAVAAWPVSLLLSALISNVSESHFCVLAGWLQLSIAYVFVAVRMHRIQELPLLPRRSASTEQRSRVVRAY